MLCVLVCTRKWIKYVTYYALAASAVYAALYLLSHTIHLPPTTINTRQQLHVMRPQIVVFSLLWFAAMASVYLVLNV